MTPRRSEKCQRALLVEHFLDRLFDSELVSRQAEARITLIQILAVLAVPGLLISIELINKYADLAAGSGPAANLASFAFTAFLVLAASIACRNRKLSRRGSFVYDVSPLQVAEPLNLSY